jgi:hypothetical protein
MSEVTKDIERRLTLMSQSQREHLQVLVYEFIKCYDEENQNCAVVLFGTSEGLGDVVTLGCDPMQTANMLLASNDLFEFINTRDAPPKEKFN